MGVICITGKEFLESIKKLKFEIEFLKYYRDQIDAMKGIQAIELGHVGSNKVPDLADKVIELEAFEVDVLERLDDVARGFQGARNILDWIDEPLVKRALFLRYVKCKKLRDIADDMQMTTSGVRCLLERGEAMLDVRLQQKLH